MEEPSGLHPVVQADAAAAGVVSHVGGIALLETVRAAGLDVASTEAIGSRRRPNAVHDPAEVLLALALALGLGGDCLARPPPHAPRVAARVSGRCTRSGWSAPAAAAPPGRRPRALLHPLLQTRRRRCRPGG